MKKLIATAFLTTGLLGVTALPVSATHTHAREIGSGKCVVLSKNGNQRFVQLPNADPDVYPENRREPHHVNVHKGRPGEVGTIVVVGTPEADEVCFLGYVNL